MAISVYSPRQRCYVLPTAGEGLVAPLTNEWSTLFNTQTSEFVFLPAIMALDAAAHLTVMCWIKPVTWGTGLATWTHKANWPKDPGPSPLGWRSYFQSNGTVSFERKHATTNLLYTSALSAFSLNTWYHIAWVTDRAAGVPPKLYINGSRHTAFSTSQNSVGAADNEGTLIMNIGVQRGLVGRSNAFDGNIDEYAIFTTLLNDATISEAYNGGAPFNMAKHTRKAYLQVFYRMGDGDSGTTILDHSGNGYTANMSNMDATDFDPDVGTS